MPQNKILDNLVTPRLTNLAGHFHFFNVRKIPYVIKDWGLHQKSGAALGTALCACKALPGAAAENLFECEEMSLAKW
jgi:hypothetical protein